MEKYSYFAERMWRFFAYILAGLMMVLIAVVFWQIICRYIFRASNGWTQEVSTLVFVWATFLGVALAIRSGSQISMKVLVDRTKEPVSHIITLFAAIICETIYAILAYSGCEAISIFGKVASPSLRISMAIPYSAIAFSGIIMLVFGVEEILKPIQQIRKYIRQKMELEER